jgi:membrane-bound inhibitor of C-type lysozyme
MIHEKRRYHRHPVNLSAQLMCDGQAVRVKMVDLSARGACLDGNGVPDNKNLRLRFVLPGSTHRLDVNVMVAWTRGANIGVEFGSMSGDSDKALKTWLREQEAEMSSICWR